MVACQGPLSMGFPSQEYRSRLPFPSPGDLPNPGIEPRSPTLQASFLPSEPLVHAKSLQSCPTLRPHGLYPSRLLCPWDSPGKNTGVRCHALLQGIFLTQEDLPVSPVAPELQADSLLLNHRGTPR